MKNRESIEFFFKEGEDKSKIELLVPEMAAKKKWWVKDTLVFVGIFKASNGDLVYCYPKYLETLTDEQSEYKDYIKEHLKTIVNVIDKLRSNGKNVVSGDNLFDEDAHSIRGEIEKVSVARFLMRDYLSNGIYQMDAAVDAKSGNGHSRWGKTVSRVNPVITNRDAIYLDVFRRKHFRDDSGEISQIHRQILSECYETLFMRGVQKNVFVERPKKKYDLVSCSSILRKRLNQVFDDRERAVLKAMISWCDKSPYYRAYAGTNDFANVWEWVNDAVWGNVAEQNSTAPYYNLFEKMYAGTGLIKPDSICVRIDNENQECIVDVLDSKYYAPDGVTTAKNDDKLELVGMPSSSDIAKQVAYRYFIERYCAGIMKKYEEKYGYSLSIRYTNSFLIPKFGKWFLKAINEDDGLQIDNVYKIVGKVSVGTFPGLIEMYDIGNDPSDIKDIDEDYLDDDSLGVNIIVIDPESLYKCYLSNPIVEVRL